MHGLHPSIQEIKAKCLEPGCDNWLHFSVFCKQFAIRALYKGTKEMETTAHSIGNVEKLVKNIPAIVLQTIPSQLPEWSSMISILLDLLQNT